MIMSFSFVGVKTGSEWLFTRSSQAESVHKCLLRAQKQVDQCISESSEIREANSKDEELEEDLNRLNNYLNKLNIK